MSKILNGMDHPLSVDQMGSLAYQEVFLKNRNSGAAAGKEEITIET